MKYQFKTILALSAMLVACSEKPQDQEKKSYKVTEISGFSLPEGAVGDGRFIYISNVGVDFKPLDKDGDGFISKLDKSGKVQELRFLPTDDTLHSPKGMTVINGVLYVTDIDRIFGFDLATRKTVFKLDFADEKTVLLNDLVQKSDTSFFVSAMDIGKVFEVTIPKKAYDLVVEMPKPNGLYWDAAKSTLFVGQFGRDDQANGAHGDITRLVFDAKDSLIEKAEVTKHQGNIDGVYLLGDKLYFTDWLSKKDKGSLHFIQVEKPDSLVEVVELHVDGPGDFYYDPIDSTFWLPKMRENKVLMIKK